MEDHQSTEKCNNCLCHLPICQAECCKEFNINVDAHKVYKKGSILYVKPEGDMRLYMLLHGAVDVGNNHLAIVLSDFKKKGGKITIYGRCRNLTEDNLCKEHFTRNRPKLCDYPNKDGTIKEIYYTKNCVFRRKQNGRE